MWTQILLFTLLPLISATEGAMPHALYLSVVQIDQSDVDSDAQILVKVFANDLQDVVRAAYPEAYERTQDQVFCASNKQAIERYFREKLNCRINGDRATLFLLNGTQENDVYWLKFRLQGPHKWQNISIQASFFMEIFSTQSNIIQIIYGMEKRFARLTQKSQTADFGF